MENLVKGDLSVGASRWESVTIERGKPRNYIQQYLDVKLPEDQYKQIVKGLGLEKPFDEETATQVMEAFIEDLGDGSQCDAVHFSRGDGLVVLMTVASYPYKQETFDHLLAAHLAKKALSGQA